MLSIFVNGKQITIDRGTTIQVEMNNNVFSTEGLEGDVAYSFDVPAAPNDVIFNSARFVYVDRKKKYDCEILIGGYSVGKGNLYITKSKKETYSCEMVINAFPDGWRDRKLCKNDFENDIIISQDYNSHQNGWLEFLQNSLQNNSEVKFPLFIDEDYYSDNDDFGQFNGKNNPPVGLLDNFGRATKFVNRFAFTNNNSVSSKQRFRNPNQTTNVVDGPWNIFNEEKDLGNDGVERNQFTFAPALRLRWLIENVIANAGYNLKGNFINSQELSNMYYQSMHSMDGTIYSEYTQHDSFFAGTLKEDVSSLGIVNNREYLPILAKEDTYGLFNSSNHTYKIIQEGVYHFKVKLKFFATPNQLYAGTSQVGCVLLFIRDFSQIPTHPIDCSVDTTTNKWTVSSGYKTLIASLPLSGIFAHDYDADISPVGKSVQEWTDDNGGPCEVEFDVDVQTLASAIDTELCFDFVFCIQSIDAGHVLGQLDTFSAMRCDADIEVKIDNVADYSMNIFSRKLHFADHVPSMTNSELLNTIKSLYGLSFMVDSSSKTIEMSFVNDILDANAVDLTDDVFNEETEISSDKAKKVTFELSPNKAPSYSEDNRMEDVEFMSQMEPARNNIGKVVLVKHLNEIFKSEQKETDTSVGWTNTWERNGGNDTKLEYEPYESDSEETVKPICEIPSVEFIHCAPTYNMTLIADENTVQAREITDEDRENTSTVHFPEIECRSISYLNNENADADTSFPLILLRNLKNEKLPSFTDHLVYQGTHTYLKRYWENDLYYHHFSPVCYDNNNYRIPGKDLTAKGDSSIGENYVERWLQLIGNHEIITYKFRFSVQKLMEVVSLFRPQNADAKSQIRWIIVENVKTLPINMRFEIVEGKDTIIAEMECAKPRS